MCAHPPTARRTRTQMIRGYSITDSYCRVCKVEHQRERRARMAGRIFGLNEELARFARLPVLSEDYL